jgi:hypothetical protein
MIAVALNTIIDKAGEKQQIARFNMPFGSVGSAEFGTYFIGYARSPEVIEQMLRNMFVGKPAGNYDRILDFSMPLTGNLFFVPTAGFLDNPPRAVPSQRASTAPGEAREASSAVAASSAAPPGPKDAKIPASELSFDADIKPLFREKDRDSMRSRLDLWSYADIQAHADAIGERLKNGSMPCDGAWPSERVGLFERWVEQGKPQ